MQVGSCAFRGTTRVRDLTVNIDIKERFVMRQVKLLMAILALGVTLSATASAELNITNLPEANTGQNWTGETDEKNPTLVGLNHTVTCEKATATGTEEKAHPLGLFHIEFKVCSAEVGGIKVTCTGLGEAAGVILSLGTWHLVYDQISTELLTATLFLPETVHFSCSILLVEVKGELLCLDLEPKVKKISHLFHCHQKGALQLETTYWTDQEPTKEVTKAELLCSENHGEFTHCAELALGLVKNGAELFADI
jgi:hypothetical protein